MHPIGHRALSFMPVLRLQALVCMLLLNARRSRLESCQVDRISIHQHFGDGADVGD